VELRCSPANLWSVKDLQFLPVYWGNLRIFSKLRSLHLVIAWSLQIKQAVSFERTCKEVPKCKSELRELMRSFLDAVPLSVTEVTSGVEDDPEYFDSGTCFWSALERYVPGDYLQRIYEEFRGLQSAGIRLEKSG
jgi:hypothetical protein